MILNHIEPKKIEGPCIAQVNHTNTYLMNSNHLIDTESISQSRDEIESEVYDKFLSTESVKGEDNVSNYVLDITRYREMVDKTHWGIGTARTISGQWFRLVYLWMAYTRLQHCRETKRLRTKSSINRRLKRP
jgi:hypothetical protein